MESDQNKNIGFAEHGLVPTQKFSGIRSGLGSQGGNKVKFSDWMKKTNDKDNKSNMTALAKLARGDSEDSDDNQKGNLDPLSNLSHEKKPYLTQDNTVKNLKANEKEGDIISSLSVSQNPTSHGGHDAPQN